MNAKEYNKYLTALQEDLGIHIVSVRNNTSVEDCHKSLAEIGKYLNDKNYKYHDVMIKRNKESVEELLKANFDLNKQNSLLKLEVEKMKLERTDDVDEIVELNKVIDLKNLRIPILEEEVNNLKNKLKFKKMEVESTESFYRGALHEKKCYIEILAAALILSIIYWIFECTIGWLIW